jgi:hypothetical protein
MRAAVVRTSTCVEVSVAMSTKRRTICGIDGNR